MDAVNERVDRAIRDAGTPDTVWLPWLAMRKIRRVPLENLCPATSRLVVVAPHPDDEILACGGLLAVALKQRRFALVIAVTNGEASHGMSEPAARVRLGARRASESLAGLDGLGVQPSAVLRLGIADGEIAQNVQWLANRLTQVLQQGDVVVTTWRLDGHPDHEATSEAVAQACTATGACLLEAPVWMWHWAHPGDARIPWDDLIAFELTPEASALKKTALLHHQSQLLDRPGKGPVLVPTIVERTLRAQEFFFV